MILDEAVAQAKRIIPIQNGAGWAGSGPGNPAGAAFTRDVIVHKDAPELDIVPTGFHAATDEWHSTHTEQWSIWCDEMFSIRSQNCEVYHNAGVWACDRMAARRFLAQVQPPFIECLMEEFQWNWRLVNAVRDGMEFHTLPDKWNHSNKSEVRTFPVWFIHVWGSEKHDEINELVP